jgi:hypothetical protein
MTAQWSFQPHSGGRPIPARTQHVIRSRICDYANAHYMGRFDKLAIDFKRQFCYLAFYRE